MNNAANKLCYLAKCAGNELLGHEGISIPVVGLNPKLRPSHNFRTTNNLNLPINFNEEDDEIRDKENHIFWQNLKAMKSPFASTITLGRKFKKNVLKLSIFNVFGNSQNGEAKNPGETSPAQPRKQYPAENYDTKPPISKSTKNLSSSKNKSLKKQKKLKAMQQANGQVPTIDVIYKTL